MLRESRATACCNLKTGFELLEGQHLRFIVKAFTGFSVSRAAVQNTIMPTLAS
jgi:hypothetical protein